MSSKLLSEVFEAVGDGVGDELVGRRWEDLEVEGEGRDC